VLDRDLEPENLILDKNKNIQDDSSYFSSSAKHLLRGMLKVNPKERLTLKHVKRHPWVLEDLSVRDMYAQKQKYIGLEQK
jgi:serine/threonine protein kinase